MAHTAESLSAKTKIHEVGGCLRAAHPDLADEFDDLAFAAYDMPQAQLAGDIKVLLDRVYRLTAGATEEDFPRLRDVKRAVWALQDLEELLR
uniref:hypothetical protein n=1 Tax=Pseudarthrobacter oxydans TaxID=1671 RepID=UPI003F492894